MSLIEAVRHLILACPHLPPGLLGVNYLAPEPPAFALNVQDGGVLRRYADGGTRKYFDVTLSARGVNGATVLAQTQWGETLEQVAAWLSEGARMKDIPPLGQGRTLCDFVAEGAFRVTDETEKTARYELKCRLTYTEGGIIDE
ncbi:MAG: hypothetical protein IJO50_05145 [Clostridia bacterium]|nr:hypothetical protein [Clostridia bacterium]